MLAEALAEASKTSAMDRVISSSGHEESLLWAYLDLAGCKSLLPNHPSSTARAMPEFEHSGLHGGVCGLAWTTQHLLYCLPHPEGCQSSARLADRGAVCDQFDEALLSHLEEGEVDSWDVSTGLLGYGIYFLDRMPRDSARKGIGLIVDALLRMSETNGAGVAWHSIGQPVAWQRDARSSDCDYDPSLPTGVAGLIYFLNRVIAAGLMTDQAELMLENAVNWLLAQQPPLPSLSWFRAHSRFDLPPGDRLAWCQGDLGVLIVLAQVARRVNHAALRTTVGSLLNHCLAWPTDLSGARNGCLANGAIGVAHFFNRLYQADGSHKCRDASIEWLEWALHMSSRDEGFLTMQIPGPHPSGARATLLDGAVGAALGLLAAVTDVEPRWDRIMCAS
jgi:hypothetical protein